MAQGSRFANANLLNANANLYFSNYPWVDTHEMPFMYIHR